MQSTFTVRCCGVKDTLLPLPPPQLQTLTRVVSCPPVRAFLLSLGGRGLEGQGLERCHGSRHQGVHSCSHILTQIDIVFNLTVACLCAAHALSPTCPAPPPPPNLHFISCFPPVAHTTMACPSLHAPGRVPQCSQCAVLSQLHLIWRGLEELLHG